jgi:hypothetical protein
MARRQRLALSSKVPQAALGVSSYHVAVTTNQACLGAKRCEHVHFLLGCSPSGGHKAGAHHACSIIDLYPSPKQPRRSLPRY